MKYQKKMNRYEKREQQGQILKESLAGEGLYLFENNSDADLTLPRPTKSGRREIGPREQFQGDNYYFQLLRTGALRLIKELQSPNQEEVMEQEKLILDQPDTVTTEGTVENIAQSTPATPCNEGESCCGGNKPDVLLNEGPSDDGFVIVED